MSYLVSSEDILVDLGSGMLHSLSGAVFLPYHGVKRRGSDAQCITAASCSDSLISDPTPSISYSLLQGSPFYSSAFLRETLKKRVFNLSCRARTSKQLCYSGPKTHHISFVFRDTWSFRILMLDIQVQKVFSGTKVPFLFLLYAKNH